MKRRGRGAFGLWWFWNAVLGILAITTVLLVAFSVMDQQAIASGARKQSEAFQPPPLDETGQPVAAFLGDSFTEAGNVKPDQSFVDIVSKYFGYFPTNDGSGGTGYLNPGPAYLHRSPIPDRVPNVVAQHPALVLVAGGINDAGRSDSDAALSSAIDKTLDGLTAGLPTARIVVVGCWWPNQKPTADAVRINGLLKKAATDRHLGFIDPIGDKWITGTNDANPPGNRAQYIGSDGTHPNAAGQAYIAGRLIDDLRQLGVRSVSSTPPPTPTS